MSSLKHSFEVVLETVSPPLAALWRDISGWVGDKLGALGDLLVRGLKAFGRTLEDLIEHVRRMPYVIRLLFALLTALAGFVVWQLQAYHMELSTFVNVNLVLGALVMALVAFVALKVEKRLNQADCELTALQDQVIRRDQSLDKYKADIFELRNKLRRTTSAEKAGKKFAETVTDMRQKRKPGDAPRQYIVDALTKCFDVSGAIVFDRDAEDGDLFRMAGSYALAAEPDTPEVRRGQGIVGQAIADGEALTLDRVPTEYLIALSGLGKSRSLNLYVLPFKDAQGEVCCVLEVATFTKLLMAANWQEVEETFRES